MTTKTEWFTYFAERKHAAKPRVAGEPAAARPARATHPEKKAVYVREESAGRASRKSTRKAANRQKTDVQFRLKRQESEGLAATRTRPPR